MGGEKLKHPKYTTDKGGSPPHGRGKALEGVALSAAHGITPAWAGKSLCFSSSSLKYWDHPRVGGEKCGSARRARHAGGSPPRGRGKENVPGEKLGAERITPAWAGKSAALLSAPSGPRDHPRMGGEKPFDNPKIDNCEGSPPHGRGKVPSVS